MMALAPNVAWLFVGRTISGIASSSFSTAGAYIADVTPVEQRAAAYGKIGVAFGFSQTFASFIGSSAMWHLPGAAFLLASLLLASAAAIS
jgi:DHA1 family tetracycline resistance protein-like MFS transporter